MNNTVTHTTASQINAAALGHKANVRALQARQISIAEYRATSQTLRADLTDTEWERVKMTARAIRSHR